MEQPTKWNCSYCYAKDISTDLRDCPVCGRRRAKEAAVFQDSTPAEPAERAQAAADWICPFCSQENAASAQVCTSCGTSRTESEKRRIELLNQPVSHALPAAEPKEKIDKVLLAKFLFVLILFLATVIGCVMIWRRSTGTYTETEINGVYWRSTVQLSNIVKFDTTDSSGKTVRYSAYPDGRAVIAEGNASTEPYYADFTLEEDETEKFRRIEYFVQINYEGAPLRLRVSRDQYDMLAGKKFVTYRCDNSFTEIGPIFYLIINGQETELGNPVD